MAYNEKALTLAKALVLFRIYPLPDMPHYKCSPSLTHPKDPIAMQLRPSGIMPCGQNRVFNMMYLKKNIGQ
jgi:hypothetical protein